ncbi:MAG: glycosyltransferase, partial [Candidatus Izemoplasmatales bacterium]
IGGYREARNWNKMHNDLTQRLEAIGIKRLCLGKTIRPYFSHISKPIEYFSCQKKNTFKPYYQWQTDRFKLSTCRTYLKQFLCHSELNEEVLKQKRKILMLVPVYNEAKSLPGFINHMSYFCDGMIFLDDNSTDNSYELIKGEKVLLKIKKRREFFNDIDNRNKLLEVSFFFNTEWLLFMDVDERFDPRYCNLYQLTRQIKFDVFAFNIIHLWDNIDTYNSTFPNSNQGLVRTCRMFQSKGHLQINTQKILHFTPIPYFTRLKLTNNPILVHHLGNIDIEARKQKYGFYQKEDRQKNIENYEYLINGSAILKEVSKIKI